MKFSKNPQCDAVRREPEGHSPCHVPEDTSGRPFKALNFVPAAITRFTDGPQSCGEAYDPQLSRSTAYAAPLGSFDFQPLDFAHQAPCLLHEPAGCSNYVQNGECQKC
jgi:hypothetical protein